MKAGWKRVKLGDAISAIGDHRGRTPPKLTFGKYRVLSAKNIKTGKIVAEDSIGYFDDDLYAKYVRMEIERGDIIITSEAPFGQVYYWNSDEKVALSQRLFSIRLNDGFEPRFVYYYLTTDEFQAELASRATGTTVMGLRQPELLKCEIICPPLPVQRRIAAMLGALDDAIELNRKMNANLEEQAQALFKSWFVDFEPWGGKMPKEWKKGTLGEFVSIRRGKVITKRDIQGGCIPVIAAGMNPAYYCAVSNVKGPSVTISASGANAGYVWLHSDGIWASDCSYVSAEETPYVYLAYLYLAHNQKVIMAKQQGSAQPHVHAVDLMSLPFNIPTKNECNKFTSRVVPIFNLIAHNESESRKLAETRDALLPKLMSGEVEVK